MIDCPLNRTKVKRGSELSWAKLDENDVANIRALIREREEYKCKAKSLTASKIAEKFDVHRRTIERITAGEVWTHVE